MPRILDTREGVNNQAEQGKTIRFLSILEAVVSVEKRNGAYIATFMLAVPRTRHLLIIHEQPFPTFESVVLAFGIDDTEEIFEVLNEHGAGVS